jgi:PAS domain S-box-containing protein
VRASTRSPLGLYVIDRDYQIQLWNRKREVGTLGVAREDAIGRSIFEVLHRQNAELMRREFDEVLATGRLQQLQLESRSTGELRTFRLTKIPMRVGGPGERDAVTHVVTLGRTSPSGRRRWTGPRRRRSSPRSASSPPA